jgi:NlpC/P60 family
MKQKLRRLILILTVASVIALVLLNLDPVSTRAQRLVILCSLAGVCFGPLFLLWKYAAARVVFVALPLLLIAPFLIPGKDIELNALRDDFLARIVSYEGIGYHWGGENRRGIDCSGLPRKALRDALLNQGLRNMNGSCTRLFLKHWWNDASAKALAEGYLDFAIPTKEQGTIATMSYGKLQPGDLAVTQDKRHVLTFLGGENWIQADPAAEKVTIANGHTGKSGWFAVPVTLHRWRELSTDH